MYFPNQNIPGLWYHKIWPIKFAPVVGKFGIKYKNKEDSIFLIYALKENYESVAE